MIKNISPQEALELSKNGIRFIDVREPFETIELSYDVPTLELMPLSEFQQKHRTIAKDEAIIIACKAGGRSMQACSFLESLGYSNLSNLDGGIMRWEMEGLPVK